jgi:hypothetical protein
MKLTSIINTLLSPTTTDHQKVLLATDYLFETYPKQGLKYILHQTLFQPIFFQFDEVISFHPFSHSSSYKVEPYLLSSTLPSSIIPTLQLAAKDSSSAVTFQSQGLICTSPAFTVPHYVQTFYAKKASAAASINYTNSSSNYWKAAQIITTDIPDTSTLWTQPIQTDVTPQVHQLQLQH